MPSSFDEHTLTMMSPLEIEELVDEHAQGTGWVPRSVVCTPHETYYAVTIHYIGRPPGAGQQQQYDRGKCMIHVGRESTREAVMDVLNQMGLTDP